jgi:hypothetical protein
LPDCGKRGTATRVHASRRRDWALRRFPVEVI